MNKMIITLCTTGLLTSANLAWADNHAGGPDPATPVELYACNFNEGMGPADLYDAIDDWNDWADDNDINDYSAWTLLPFYRSPQQEFDIVWLGASPSAAAMGRAQDLWLTEGGQVAESFAEVFDCGNHAAFAVLEFKEPPERENPDNIVISFSDCNIDERSSMPELVPAMMEWGEYRGANGSTAGLWAMMPAMGGGGEAFDFKWISAYQNLEDLGKDFDQYSEAGWQKGRELFAGKVSCDSSRVYVATNHRRGEDSDD